MSVTLQNNLYWPGDWSPDLALVEEQPFRKGLRNFFRPRVRAGRLFVSRGDYLACIDPSSRAIVWDIELAGNGLFEVDGDEALLLTNAQTLCALDGRSGRLEPFGDRREFVHAMGSGTVITSVRTDDGRVLRRRAYAGDMEWERPLEHGPIDGAGAGGDCLVTVADAQLSVRNLANGEIRWTLEPLAWCEAHRPDLAAAWHAQSPAVQAPPALKLGPVIDGCIYLSLSFGLVLALELETGELRWQAELAAPTDLARTMIYRKGALYLNSEQAMGRSSYACGLRVADGSRIFQHEEPFTPAGCTNPVLLGRLLIGGSEAHIAAFDVESQEFVWRYRHRKSEPFRARPAGVEGGFVQTDGKRQSLLWFKAKT